MNTNISSTYSITESFNESSYIYKQISNNECITGTKCLLINYNRWKLGFLSH